MKRLITILLLMLSALLAAAQSNNAGTLKFMGIPIDGPKKSLIEKIEGKGFTYNPYKDCLRGQFNGRNVDVYVVDNHGTAYRVFVSFPECSENRIRSEYNHLLNQFLRNDKYIGIKDLDEIGEKEDIYYQMEINKKHYGASFAYVSPDVFDEEQIKMIHEIAEQVKVMNNDDIQALGESLWASYQYKSPSASTEEILTVMNKLLSIAYGNVWFTLHRDGGDYRIGLYYDNVKNMPNGEDL